MPLLHSQQSSITGALATSPDGIYEPVLPPVKETMTLNVVSEIMYDGRAQNINKIYVTPATAWEHVRESLRRASEGWQMGKIAGGREGKKEQEGGGDEVKVDKDGDGGRGDVSGRRRIGEWKGKYQIVNKKGVLGKQVFDLRDESEWRLLRWTVVKEGKGVVVWDARVFQEMQARKAWLAVAEKEELVDFHNACEMDRSSLTTGVDLKRFSVELDDEDETGSADA